MFRKRLLVFFLIFFAAQGTASAEEPWERFAGSNEESKVHFNHEPLTEALEISVLPVGRSRNLLGNEKADTYHNSRIKTAENLGPSRYEGNRVFFHAFNEALEDFYHDYQAGLEAVSQSREITNLKKDEQLAYWLNLHNVIIINKLHDEYPMRRLSALRDQSGRKGFWFEKAVNVGGVPLSLYDIEQIVIRNWNSPLVIYGLWQGSIGGPTLPREAYEADTVWGLLDKNAVEFVNSNRGARPKDDYIQVSDFYEWVLPAFDNSEERLLRHIQVYSDPAFHGDISGFSKIKFKYYDWVIADLIGGSLHSGGLSQPGGVLSGRAGGAGSSQSGGAFSNFTSFYDLVVGRDPLGPKSIIPPAAMQLFEGIVENNNYPRLVPYITTEECGPDEECWGEGTGEENDE